MIGALFFSNDSCPFVAGQAQKIWNQLLLAPWTSGNSQASWQWRRVLYQVALQDYQLESWLETNFFKMLELELPGIKKYVFHLSIEWFKGFCSWFFRLRSWILFILSWILRSLNKNMWTFSWVLEANSVKYTVIEPQFNEKTHGKPGQVSRWRLLTMLRVSM